MSLRRIASAIALTLFTGSLAVACGDGELGESCDTAGKTDGECEDGLVCGKDTSGALLCLKTCADSTACSSDRECNGVEGTNIKACRLKTTK